MLLKYKFIFLKSNNIGFNTNEIGWSYIIMKTVNYLCILFLIAYYFISLSNIGNFTSYLNQQIMLLIFIIMGLSADYPNFCTNPSSSVQSIKRTKDIRI